MGLLDIVFPGKTKLGVAANILAAKYTLEGVSPKIVGDALHDIVDKLWRGYNQGSPEEAYLYFMDKPRNVQLNLFAQAFDNINIAPLLKGEYWTRVRNPLLPTIYDDSFLTIVSGRFYKMYGEDIHVPNEPFTPEELEVLLGMK
jgi:hypothetical protein